MKHVNTPHLHEDPTRTTSIGMARYAAEFMEAALAADGKMGNKPGHEVVAPIPVMFLVGRHRAFVKSRRPNQSLHWTQTSLCSICASEFRR